MAPILPLPAAAGFVGGPVLGYVLGTALIPRTTQADLSPAADARRQARDAREGAIALGVTAVASLLLTRSSDPQWRSIATGAAIGSAIGGAALLLRARQAEIRRDEILRGVTPPPATTSPSPAGGTGTPAPAPTPGLVVRPGDTARVPEAGAFAFQRPEDRSAMLPVSGPFGVVVTGVQNGFARVQITTTHPNPPPWREFWVRTNQLQPLASGPVPPRAPANTIGCTPLNALLPEPALNQANTLLALDLNDPRPERRPSAASVDTMRTLAANLRYCGAELGAQGTRDRVVADLERRALEVEAALRTPPPQPSVTDAALAFQTWSRDPTNATLRDQYVTTFRAVFGRDPPLDGTRPPELEGRV